MGNGLIREIDLHDSVRLPATDDTQTTTSEVTRLNCLNKNLVSLVITGKTIVNLLGVAGDCEDVSLWNDWRTTHALDSSNKVFGNNGFKITINTGQTDGTCVKNVTELMTTGKYYCFSGYVKNGNLSTGITLNLEGYTTNTRIVDTTKFNRIYSKVRCTGINTNVSISIAGSAGQYAYVDGIMLEEISAEDYNNPNWKPSPYVSGDTSVGDTAGRIKSVGKNKIKLVQGGVGNAGNISVDNKRITHKDGAIVVSPNTTYTVSLNTPMYYAKNELDANKNIEIGATWSASPVTSLTFTTGVNTKYVGIAFKLDDTMVIYPQDYQIMINEGAEAVPYEEYQETVMPIPYPLKSLPSGVADTQDTKKGKVIKKIEKILLDGNAGSWFFQNTYAGYKLIGITTGLTNMKDSALSNIFALKYNNKNISALDSTAPFTAADQIKTYSDNRLFITIPQADSGWGDAYQPNADEIKAQRLGWKMVLDNSGRQIYNGTGTKAWIPVHDQVNGAAVYSCPTTLAPGFTPDRLYYQLATPIELDIPVSDLVALPNGSLVMENDAQSWVRPSVAYTLNKNSRANLEHVMQQAANNNTYKPLNGVYATTQDIKYYVDASKGDDVNNNGLSPDKPFKTIMKAVNSLPQVINHMVNIYIAAGTYNESLNIVGFTGKGSLNLYGSCIVNNIVVSHCNCYVYVDYFTCNTYKNYDGYTDYCVNVEYSTNVYLNRITAIVVDVSKKSFSGAICVQRYSTCCVYNSTLSNANAGIAVNLGSYVFSSLNTGSGNNYGLQSMNGSTLCKDTGVQPSGATAERTMYGSIIR